jgi:hypothetical protein
MKIFKTPFEQKGIGKTLTILLLTGGMITQLLGILITRNGEILLLLPRRKTVYLGAP